MRQENIQINWNSTRKQKIKKMKQNKLQDKKSTTSIAPFLFIFTPTDSSPKFCNVIRVNIKLISKFLKSILIYKKNEVAIKRRESTFSTCKTFKVSLSHNEKRITHRKKFDYIWNEGYNIRLVSFSPFSFIFYVLFLLWEVYDSTVQLQPCLMW